HDVADWDEFLRLATGHAIVPLVDQYLTRHGSRGVPPHVFGHLRDGAQASAVRSLRLSAQLVSVLRAFESEGIEAMPFKGPSLALLVYGNLSLRQFDDLDILVRRNDIERARRALSGIGFAPVLAYSDDQRASIQLSGHHEQLVDASSGTTVELHWLLNHRAQSRESSERQWWENEQAVSIGGVAAHTLGRENLLLYLCMHGGKHGWARLAWLSDLAHALRAYPDADWSWIWRRGRETGSTRMLTVGVGLARALLSDRSITDSAIKGRPRDTKAEALVALFSARLRGPEIRERPVDLDVQLQMRERLRDRLRYTWHVVAMPHASDVGVLKLPRSLHGAYYVMRPVRLLWKYLVRYAKPEGSA
ncbi:MAG TPA: nucleotidyltransferase family protein, partial [Gemmatimonadaceae bacterium]